MRKGLHFLVILCLGCSTVYYTAWETFGREKRDLLRSNLLELKEDQTEVQEEFKDALNKIRNEYKFDSTHLRETYDQMSADFEELKEEVDDISDRVSKIKTIAHDLFKEWKEEAYELNDKQYRKASLEKLKNTKKHFDEVQALAKESEAVMFKVLRKYKDQVVFIKHNLNAQVVANLGSKMKALQDDMDALIKSTALSIKKAQSFIDTLK